MQPNKKKEGGNNPPISALRNRMKICKVIIVICIALCVLLTFFFYGKVANALHSHGWPTVRGEVTRSYVRKSTTGTSGEPNFWPEVHYVYNVGGIKYEGKNIFFLEDGRGLSWSKGKVQKYNIGKPVQVFYKSQNPQISVLEPGGTIKGVFLSGAFHFILIGILLLLSSALLWDHQKAKKEIKKQEVEGPQIHHLHSIIL